MMRRALVDLACGPVFSSVIFDRPTPPGKRYNRCVADDETFTTSVPHGDFIVSERPTRWLVRRVVGDRASQTRWAFDGEAPAVAQALIFARNDRTAAWLRVDDRRFRLLQSFRPPDASMRGN